MTADDRTKKAPRRATITVTGLVQGVGYRYWAYEQLGELGLTGRPENQTDGSVLIEVTGSKTAIVEFARRCHQGPPLAHVSDVQVEYDR
jgi:acylphosphatase